ncbi:hypothetical protein F4780DRAFT_795578 [Xylariomycetidae sp. FL0641]|nr:hypothetical protein F4780DRAFT_795578 [Xylariomycetidae sp. FL0641]
MAASDAFKEWYSNNTEELVTVYGVYIEAVVAFSNELSKDPGKLKWISDPKHGNLNGVLEAVTEAQLHYQQRSNSEIRQVLAELTERVHSYEAIMDVLVSSHPEFAALGWGAMKFLIAGVVNHQKVLSKLSTGLNKIAKILPRSELILKLYPVQHVKKVIVEIYAHILKFLLRALRWYQSSKWKHLQDALIKPAELQYDDLLNTISLLSHTLTEVGLASSHAEQRDMHASMRTQGKQLKDIQEKVGGLVTVVCEMRASMADEFGINATARIEVRQQLSKIQLHQFMDHLAAVPLPSSDKSLQASLFMASRRWLKRSNRGPPFWLDGRMQRWNHSRQSSLVVINGTRKLRHHLQYFSARSVSVLEEASIPVIWALKPNTIKETTADQVSTIDILKYLISQAVSINKTIQTNAALTPCLSAYRGARSEKDWINILASVLDGIPLLYIVLDMEVLSQSLEMTTKDFWPGALLEMFSGLAARNIKTVVRVALVSYGSPLLKGPLPGCPQDSIVQVGGMRQQRAAMGTLPTRHRDRGPATSSNGTALDTGRLADTRVRPGGRRVTTRGSQKRKKHL